MATTIALGLASRLVFECGKKVAEFDSVPPGRRIGIVLILIIVWFAFLSCRVERFDDSVVVVDNTRSMLLRNSNSRTTRGRQKGSYTNDKPPPDNDNRNVLHDIS